MSDKPIDPMDGATPEQRYEAMTLCANSQLVPRFVRRAEPSLNHHLDGPAAERLNAVGDSFGRCQVGEVFAASGSFAQGGEKFHWSDNNMFRLLGHATTFAGAVEMARKKAARE